MNRIPKRKELFMYRTAVMSLVVLFGFSLYAQTVNITGKVTNLSGKGIAGAAVTLASKKLSATTDASGAYALKGDVAVNPAAILSSFGGVSLNKGIVTVTLTQPTPVQIEIFDIQGNLLERMVDKPASAGTYQFNLMKQSLAANMMMIRASIGRQTMSFRYFPFNNGKCEITAGASGQRLVKMAAINDTLQASATRYTTKRVAITSYEGTVDISLDTANCSANPSKPVSNAKASGSGTHKVVMETNSDAGINKGTIYRPEDIGPGKNYPLFLWGEGGCSQDGCSNQAAMGEFASWGYFIVADGTPGNCRSMLKTSGTTGGSMGDPKQFYGYLDWVFAQNRNPCSAYYQTIDTTKVAADGFSCGGLMSENASGDRRFTAIGFTSSGLQSPNATLYDKIHTPFKIMNGGSGDMAYENGLRDYDEISKRKIPIIYYSKTSAGHGGDLTTAKGDFNTVNLAWLNWQLKGDTGATGKALLIGSSCKFCTNSGWVFKSANIQ
jgi:hypothetical protein